MEHLLFFFIAALSIISAIAVVFNKNVVHSALLLLVNFATISIFYFMLNAQFLGVVQILVYAGAIVVLFLFVVMLLGADLGEEIMSWLNPQTLTMMALGAGLLIITGVAVFGSGDFQGEMGTLTPKDIEEYGQAQIIGVKLFTDHFLSVQLAGILLLVGIVGVIWLARNDETQSLTDDVLTPESRKA